MASLFTSVAWLNGHRDRPPDGTNFTPKPSIDVYYSYIRIEMSGPAFEVVSRCTGFQWDQHNSLKNWERHQVSVPECEGVFFNIPLIVQEDPKHSQREPRFYCLGQTDAGRPLFMVFTIRGTLIRVISAREMSRKEREVYWRS